jgi:hypothetical protein
MIQMDADDSHSDRHWRQEPNAKSQESDPDRQQELTVVVDYALTRLRQLCDRLRAILAQLEEHAADPSDTAGSDATTIPWVPS